MSDHSHDTHGGSSVHPDHGDDDRRITYFASTHTRGQREMFGIRAVDRGKHVYVIGKTGMGKSTMLENMAIQDIQNGEGIAFIDPHGSTAEKLLDFIPQDRINDVVYFAPFDTDHPIGFNVMEDVGYDKRHLVVSGLMGALKRIWVDAWSARMEYILQNTLLALLEYPGSTLLDVNRMLTNKTFRNAVIAKISDPIVKSFWVDEFAAFTDTYTREATPAIQNKIGQFVANPLIRHIIGQPKSSFDLREIMDKKKIFIVNLSKGRMGETNASLLGSMLTVKIYLAAMSRADEPAARMAKLPRFYFYVDEFQSMMNEAFADILSESRKYKLALTLANQYIEQMEEEVRDAVFGNVGTLICFRVGPFDAEVLETVFDPTFTPEDLVGLGIGQIYLTLMIDGVGSAPFSAETIPPIEAPDISYRDDVVEQSRRHYGRARSLVETEINRKQMEFVPPPPEKKEKRYGAPQGGGGGSFSPRRDPVDQGREPRSILANITLPQNQPPVAEPAPRVQTEHASRPAERPAQNGWSGESNGNTDQRPSSRPQEVVHSHNSTHVRTEAVHHAPQNTERSRDERRAPHDSRSSRSALLAAISAAKASDAPAPAPQPIRSPLDVIREKKEAKQQSKPEDRQQSNARPHERQRGAHHERESAPKKETEHAFHGHADSHNGEVAPHILQQVLNGHGGHARDNDDL